MAMRVSHSRSCAGTCPRCSRSQLERSVHDDRYRDEPLVEVRCGGCGADLDPDTLTDLGTTYGEDPD